jgi:hypothetical protein
MYKIRQWSVTNSRKLEAFYRNFEPVLVKLHPLFNALGYGRLEAPVRVIEKAVKGLMFDCQMCGKCALSSTGMSCPMNCPKSIRNGPCGGVRLDGHCEVKPEMRCVWVEAWRGSQQMRDSEAIRQVQIPIDNLLKGSSSWLRVVREVKTVAESEAVQ